MLSRSAPGRSLLHAKSHGAATVVVWARNGQRNFYNISVEHNVLPIRKIIEVTFPTEDIHVQSAQDSVTLTGTGINAGGF